MPLGDSANTCRVHWNTTGKTWNCPTSQCHWRNSNFCCLHWNTTGGTVGAPPPSPTPNTHTHTGTHTEAYIAKQSGIHASLKWKDGGTPISKWTGLCNISFYSEFTALQWIQHHSVHAFYMSTIIVFVYFGLQVKWSQFSPHNSHHTSCIHKGLHAGKWPGLMTSKPYSVSGIPLDRPHCKTTGATSTLRCH